ncbi:MAG: 2OG-Fe(II) oxygenase [Flavobacteriales bacterium]|nr:2OG-Fe(II) oxygenase [Flavobacteriales bacterium]
MKTKVGVVDSFLSEEIVLRLRQNLINLYEQDRMHPAGVGNGAKFHRDPENRGDQIFWLDRKHKSASENEFLDLIDSFVIYLNTTCYAGITGYEFHYALGELCVYLDGKDVRISPEGGRCVFFKSSELEHEVLPSKSPRMSLTGWLKKG